MPPRKESAAMRYVSPAVSVMALIFTLAGGYSNLKLTEATVTELKGNVTDLRKQLDTTRDSLQDAQHASDLRVQRVEDNYRALMESLGELKSDIRDIKDTVGKRGSK